MFSRTRYISVALSFAFFFPIHITFQDTGMDQISTMIREVPGLNSAQVNSLVSAFDFEMGGRVFGQRIDETYLRSMQRIVNAGIFEEAEPRAIAVVAHSAYQAERRGAPMEYVEDLALVGFARSITGTQLEGAAKMLQRFAQTNIDPLVYQELLSYGLAADWPAETLVGVSEGLIRGKNAGVDVGKLALAMIIRVDQGLQGKTIRTMVDEEIDFIRDRGVDTGGEKARRDVAYQAMQRATQAGVPHDIAQQLYTEAVEERWPQDVVTAVFGGMIQAKTIGLTPEKVALAMIIRVEQGLGETSPSQMVQEELAYVAGLEKKRLDAIKNDKSLDYSKPAPAPKTYEVYVEPKKPDPKTDQKKQVVYNQSNRTALNVSLMQQSINSFMGVSYRWGGNTRRGTDCSGFTQTVYKEQGVFIPRVSRQQYTVGRAVTQRSLRYGDLVFFNKYGYGRITHVGLYVGNGNFAHASCSKGVTITRLNKRYYQVRYAGAKRMI